jgi:tetratricopeptide (TPR) repeat protein
MFSLLEEFSSDLVKGAILDSDVGGRILLEQGLLQHTLSNDRSAADYFVKAARATGLEYELSGALGKRTKFQQTDVSQLVLLAQSLDNDNAADKDTKGSSLPQTLPLNDDTLLERTEFTSSDPTSNSRLLHLDPNSQPPLRPLDQCILLALCLNVKNTSPAHGLTSEQMSPYVSRVIAHPLNWSIHTMALLLRSRLESNRTRTVERSTLQLQALVDQMPTADSSVTERLLYFHSIQLPSKWEMEKELALRFLSIGVVKSALEIFERLEMWEEVVKCWQSIERRDKGIAIVRDLLEGRKAEADAVISRGKASADGNEKQNRTHDAAREAKLWCLLGDLEPEHSLEHYTRAWDVSKNTSGRAIRALGGYHFAKGDYLKTIECLKQAVAINPLLSRSWFILGCACVRLEDWDGAREAFVRCVSIDDEDGESWNNLATVYLRMAEDVTNKVSMVLAFI